MKKRIIILCGIFLMFDSLLLAQTAPDTLWTRTFGGSGYEGGESVQQTTDGGYIITGYTYSYGSGNRDVYLIKTDSNGDTIWTKVYGESGYDSGYSVQQTTDGGYIIAAVKHTNIDKGWLIKTDANGDTLWTKTFDGSYNYIYSVKQTTDLGFIITGTISSYTSSLVSRYKSHRHSWLWEQSSAFCNTVSVSS